MDPTKELLILQSPRSPSEWDAYFDLRCRILRQPWGQHAAASVILRMIRRFIFCYWRGRESFGLRSIAFDPPWRGPVKIHGGRRTRAWLRLRRSHPWSAGSWGPEAVVLPRSCLTRAITPWHSTESAVTTSLAMPKRYLEWSVTCGWKNHCH